MPDAQLVFNKPKSLLQSLVMNISDKFHVFPGGKVRGQNFNIIARNITIEVAGEIKAKSSGFNIGPERGQ